MTKKRPKMAYSKKSRIFAKKTIQMANVKKIDWKVVFSIIIAVITAVSQVLSEQESE